MKLRILALLLAALMILSLPACSVSNTPADTDGNPEGTTVPASSEESTTAEQETDSVWKSLSDGLETVDYDGEILTVYTGQNVGPGRVAVFELTSERVSDAMYIARENVESRFNCKVRTDAKDFTGLNTSEVVHAAIAVADDTYCVTLALEEESQSLMSGGCYLDLTAFPTFDFSREWYWNGTEQLSIGNMQYLVSSMFSLVGINSVFIMIYNKELANDLGVTIPYEDIFAGNWYMDDYIELCSAVKGGDLNGDGEYKVEDDLFASSFSLDYGENIQASLDISFVQKDADDMPYFSNVTDRASVFMEKFDYLFRQEYYIDSWPPDSFTYGRLLTTAINIGRISRDITPSDVIYGFLPMPKLDETQEEYRFGYYDFPWGVPVSAKNRIDFIATIVEAMQCQYYNLAMPEYFESNMKFRMADSPEDTQVLSMVLGRMHLSLGKFYGGAFTKLSNLAKTETADTLASTISKYEKSCNKLISTLTKKMTAFSQQQ